MFANFKNQNLQQVTIVDPDPSVIATWRQLLQRGSVARARWTYYDDFSDYVTRMDD